MVVALTAARNRANLNLDDGFYAESGVLIQDDWKKYFSVNEDAESSESMIGSLSENLGLLGLSMQQAIFEESTLSSYSRLLRSLQPSLPSITMPIAAYCRIMKLSIQKSLGLEIANEVKLMEKQVCSIFFDNPSDNESSQLQSVFDAVRHQNLKCYSTLLLLVITSRSSFIRSSRLLHNVDLHMRSLSDNSSNNKINELKEAFRMSNQFLRRNSIDYITLSSILLQRLLSYMTYYILHMTVLNGIILSFFSMCHNGDQMKSFVRAVMVDNSRSELLIINIFIKLKYLIFLHQYLKNKIQNEKKSATVPSLGCILVNNFVREEIRALICLLEEILTGFHMGAV